MAKKLPNETNVRLKLKQYMNGKNIVTLNIYEIFTDWKNVKLRLDIIIRTVLRTIEKGGYAVEIKEKTCYENNCFAKIVDSVSFIAKPSNGFIRLNNYLRRCTGKQIGVRDIVKMRLDGNGDSYEEKDLRFLAHDDKACLALLEWLKRNKTASSSIEILFDSSIDYGDRRDDCSKWAGKRDCFARFLIRTQGGSVSSYTSTSSFFI